MRRRVEKRESLPVRGIVFYVFIIVLRFFRARFVRRCRELSLFENRGR